MGPISMPVIIKTGLKKKEKKKKGKEKSFNKPLILGRAPCFRSLLCRAVKKITKNSEGDNLVLAQLRTNRERRYLNKSNTAGDSGEGEGRGVGGGGGVGEKPH